MTVAVLAGGVGAARFLEGLVQVVPGKDITVVGNVADDLELLGLHISPDLDTVVYTLAGVVDHDRGWGVGNDTANARRVIDDLRGPAWFYLSDRDIGLHLVRTDRLRHGESLSSITQDVARRFGLEIQLLPATNEYLRTIVTTDEGDLDFQRWFVAQRHEPPVRAIRYQGAADALPAPGVLEALRDSEVVVIAPSNPYLSIDPIFSIHGIRDALQNRARPVVGVTPIVGGRALKGPADSMLVSLAGEASAVTVARHYEDVLTHFLLDRLDEDLVETVQQLGIAASAVDTLMVDVEARARLARETLRFAGSDLA